MSNERIDLIVIDGQNDFLDPNGALYVQGAELEAVKLAAMIDRLGSKIYKIHATLDSHFPVDIAHPIMWVDENGNHPTPMITQITADDVRSGKWKCSLVGNIYDPIEKKNISFREKCLKYVEALETNGRYPLTIWNPHCLIGSWGHNVFPALFEAYSRWNEKSKSPWVNYVVKGDNVWTEHYSAIKADVPDPTDPKTQLNTPLLETINNADMVVWSGWAGSHCLANTANDVSDFGAADEIYKKSILLEDLSAPVVTPDPQLNQTFADYRTDFIENMRSKGVKITTSEEFLT